MDKPVTTYVVFSKKTGRLTGTQNVMPAMLTLEDFVVIQVEITPPKTEPIVQVGVVKEPR